MLIDQEKLSLNSHGRVLGQISVRSNLGKWCMAAILAKLETDQAKTRRPVTILRRRITFGLLKAL